jgi:chorismate-pyruvate lyase
MNKELRTLESDTRMRFLIGNNPMGEIVKILNRECRKRKHITKRKTIC